MFEETGTSVMNPLLALGLLTALLVPLAVTGQDRQTAPGFEEHVRPVLETGRTGMVYFPARDVGGGIEEILDPRGVEVHLTRAHEPGEELVRPAGEPFVVPGATWRVWLEGDWTMSPFTDLVSFVTRPGEVFWNRLPLVPAGRVSVPRGLPGAKQGQLWLLYAGASQSGVPNELSRRRDLDEVGDGLLMPEGPVLAALRDDRGDRYLALSRPFTVVAGTAIEAPLQVPPPERSWLISYFTRPSGSPVDSLAQVALKVSRDDREIPPEVTVVTEWGVYNAWYGLPPGPASLTGGSETLYPESPPLDLSQGEIASVQGRLSKRPILDVNLVLPSLVREKPFSLQVWKLPERERLAEAKLPRNAGRYRFQEGLVQGLLEVVLVTHVGSFEQRVDLTGLEEGFVGLEPELIELYGTVRRGGELHPATVTFETITGDSVEAVADEDGRYRAVALQPLRLVSVAFDGIRQEPWQRMYLPPLDSSQELDFDVPDAEVSVRVVDAASGQPIAGADVAVRNEVSPRAAADASDRGQDNPRMQMIGRSHRTDDDGVVELPPPRPGRVVITAFAQSYRPLEEPLALDILDPPQDQQLEIRLEPIGKTVEMRLKLPDGSPAAGAEVVRVDAIPWSTTSFTGRADAGGVVTVPAEPAEGLLLLRHPGAAFGIVEWRAGGAEDTVEWMFSPAAPPLVVRAWDPSGEEPAPHAEIALWVGGRNLSGAALHWLTETLPMTDADGFWSPRHLPPEPVHVLGWDPVLEREARAGDLDSMGTEIEFPWSGRVDVRIVQ